MFTNTLRHLDIRRAGSTGRDLLSIISQFPLFDDLTIVSSASYVVVLPGHPVTTIKQSPPFRGRFFLVNTVSRELSNGLAAFPDGLNFRSLELFWCEHPRAVLAAWGRTVTSISYFWLREHDSESNDHSCGYRDVTIGD